MQDLLLELINLVANIAHSTLFATLPARRPPVYKTKKVEIEDQAHDDERVSTTS
jgi:hypothetical protein